MPITKTGKIKNGLQQYRVRVNYTTPAGQYKQIERTAYGKAEAQELERRLLSECRDNAVWPGRITVAELADEYLQSVSHEIRETTLATKRQIIEQGILPMFSDTRIDRLTSPMLQHWKNEIAGRNLAKSTMRHYYAHFFALLGYAVKMQYIPSNPLTLVGNFKNADAMPTAHALQYYTANEFRRYAEAARTYAEKKDTITAWGYYVFFSIAFYTGMRRGEINALRWSDIDGNIIHVRRSISQQLKGRDVETPPKTQSSYRDLQAPIPLLDILDAHRVRQQKCGQWDESWRVCGGAECLRDSNIKNHNRLYADAAGLPHIRIHDFRHTHATLLVNEGINIQEIARRLGHSNVEITWKVYAHLYPREEERAVSILNQISI